MVHVWTGRSNWHGTEALSTVECIGPPRGLSLNRSKSVLHLPATNILSTNPLLPDIPTTSDRFVLRSPIGPPSFCNSYIKSRVGKLSHALPDLQDSQLETTLLRACLGFPTISFSLCTCPSTLIKEATQSFDSLIRSSLGHCKQPFAIMVFCEGIPPCLLRQCGPPKCNSTCAAAYIGSVLGLEPLIADIRHCLQYWLGTRLFPSSYNCHFCSSTCDTYGDHQVECSRNKDNCLLLLLWHGKMYRKGVALTKKTVNK